MFEPSFMLKSFYGDYSVVCANTECGLMYIKYQDSMVSALCLHPLSIVYYNIVHMNLLQESEYMRGLFSKLTEKIERLEKAVEVRIGECKNN